MKKTISLMQNIGFTQYESQVYLALLQQSNISGYELAKISGVPASKIYQILNKLTDKEMILAIDSEPKKYAPLPPEEILSRFKNDYLGTIDNLTDKLGHLYANDEASESYIWNLSGRLEIIRKIVEFIDQAKRNIFLSIWDEEVDELQEALIQTASRDVEITIVHFGKKLLGIGDEYSHGNEHKIRIQRGGRRIALIVDDNKVVLGHFQKNGSSTAAWTANKGLVLLAKDYIIHDIYSIRIVQKYGQDAIDLFRM
jgi:sugar-specific transcriptional regulator TrmB